MSVEAFVHQLAPEIVLLIGACAVLLVGAGASRTPGASRSHGSWVPFTGLLTVLLALGISISMGVPDGTSAGFGLWPTTLTYYTRCITLGIGALLILINWQQPVATERGEYLAMILCSLLGVLLTSSANDWIVLFFAIELVSVPTYVLIALSREDARASEATVKYFFLGAMSAALLAYGLSFLYGVSGTTTIHRVIDGVATTMLPATSEPNAVLTIGLLLVFAGLSFKVAAVPLHFYAADVYEGAASPVTALLAFVPKFAGFLALIKVFGACHWTLQPTVWWMVWIVAIATMTTGNVLALLQRNAKRMLAYSSIAHTGYMLIALLVGPLAGEGPMHDGIAALLFYIAVYGVMNLGVFAILAAYQTDGNDVETLDDLAGLAIRAPLAAFALAVCVFSLMGFPPTAGFLGKLYIFSSALSFEEGYLYHGPLVALAIIGVLNSAIAAAYYLRIVATAYMGKENESVTSVAGLPLRIGLALATVPLLIVFAWPAGMVSQARGAATALRDAIRPATTTVTSSADTDNAPPASSAHSTPPGS